MAGRIAVLSFLFIFLVSLSGCATGRKERDLELQGLRNQITVLETQVQTKEEEINSLRESLNAQVDVRETAVSKQAIEAKSRPNTKQIQIALRNAGFYQGAIDGKKGRKTVEAIKSFQKANNLTADGKVGKTTWSLLKEYLDKKIK